MEQRYQIKRTNRCETAQQALFHTSKTFNKKNLENICVSSRRSRHFAALTLAALFIFFSLTIFPEKSLASNERNLELNKKYSAFLEKCVDGDTAYFNINGKVYKTRFLYINTPESTNKVEPYGSEAAEFSCSKLKEGNITLETDGGNLFDKYDRLLAWVWIDDKLLQEEITRAGLVKGFYDYGDYRYEERIHAAMEEAKTSQRGMYEEDGGETNINNFLVIAASVIIVVGGLLLGLKKNIK